MFIHAPAGPGAESESPASPASFWGLWLPRFAVLLAFFAVAVLFQHWGAAYRTELGGYPDEPAHFVTGVMVRNYLLTMPPAPMVPFAADYYVHYPKVAVGHWPPVFYFVQGVWFLLLGVSRSSILLLIALISSLVSVTLFTVVRKEFGFWAGVAAGLLFQCIPLVWAQTEQVMLDLPVALLGLWAALAFADFVREDRRGSLFWFVLLANLAILTKSSGIYLALVPPLTLAMTKRLRRLLSPWVWLAALLVGLPAGVWFAFTHTQVTSTWSEPPSLSFFLQATSTNALLLVSAFGMAFSVLICAGLFRKCVQPFLRHESSSPLWAGLASVAVSVYLSQSVLSAGLEARFMVPAIPALIPFVFAGAEGLAQLTARLPGTVRIRTVAVLACSAGLFMGQTFTVPTKPYWGFTEIADFILSRPESRGAAMLVSSEADGEGLLIAEIAMRQPRPGAFVLRASKVLARSDWLGRGYQARFQSASDVMRYLDDIPVDFVVIETRSGVPPLLHHRQLAEGLEQRPDNWRPVGEFPRQLPPNRQASSILVYQRKGAPGFPEKKVRLEMGRILQEILSK